MQKLSILFFFCWISIPSFAQLDAPLIKVYDFDDGLSHRNVSKIVQDQQGFLWVATINGLNRFDGYQFLQYNSNNRDNYIPQNAISDMVIDDNNQLWLAHPDFITFLDPTNNQTESIQIKEGSIIRRESKVPHSLYIDNIGRIWTATFDEKSADNHIQIIELDSRLETVFKVDGNYIKRPFTEWNDEIFIGAQEGELWRVDRENQLMEKVSFKDYSQDNLPPRIVQLLAEDNIIWVLLLNGQLLSFDPVEKTITEHPINKTIKGNGLVTNFHKESNGNIWVSGQEKLWFWDESTSSTKNYHNSIKQILKDDCTYRQVFQDVTGVIWVASDHGLIQIAQPDNLFSKYLEGGNEYCSNVLCSTRGITEDESGNIYISYYNSIHVLDPKTGGLRLLFPANDYFNYPFGLLYHDEAIWTGNGQRIDLKTLEIDTLFQKPPVDMGAVAKDYEGDIWFGYMQWLYQYNPAKSVLLPYEDFQGRWDSLDGIISHIYQGKTGNFIWVSTLDKGLFQVSKDHGRLNHFTASPQSKLTLSHPQVNAVIEDNDETLWVSTSNGLNRIDLNNQTIKHYFVRDGLPNNFVNGVLLEGDSAIWISTEKGLSRMDKKNETFNNFDMNDGLSVNELNRMSFFKSRDGRMYFGGMNGVNAFYPNKRMIQKRSKQDKGHIVFSQFTKFDDSDDSLYVQMAGVKSESQITLTYNEKIFTIDFSLANFGNASTNQYAYMLDDYESSWSPPSSINTVRYNNIPAGNYTFRVKAKTQGKDWLPEEGILYIKIKEAFYRTWWFITLCLSILLGSMYSVFRYRIYRAKKRAEELEIQVQRRTEELEIEKQKSEELLLNILPAEIAEELKRTGVAKAKRHEAVTVMFSDFKSFTKISEQMEPEELVAEIDLCFRAFDKIVEKYDLEKIKTIGDAYLCVGGITESEDDVAVRIIKAAMEIQEFLKKVAIQKEADNAPFFEARIGVHTGPIVAGIVGIKKFVYDIWGDTVNIASRMETNGQVGKVNISETTYQLVKGHFEFENNGIYNEVEKRSINMYFVKNTHPVSSSKN